MADLAAALDVPLVMRMAALAELELTPDEAVRFARELESIANHVREIQGLDLEGIEPTSFIRFEGEPCGASHEAIAPELREGIPRDGLTLAEALHEAPAADELGFSVPAFAEEG